jgi:hypothetical protein
LAFEADVGASIQLVNLSRRQTVDAELARPQDDLSDLRDDEPGRVRKFGQVVQSHARVDHNRDLPPTIVYIW